VVARIKEHDQLHLILHRAIVLLKVLDDLVHQDLKVFNLSVYPGFDVDTIHVVSEHEPLGIEDVCFFELEGFAGLYRQLLVEPISVNIIDQSVTEDSLVLVDPKTY
jgi:hypothetical protein